MAARWGLPPGDLVRTATADPDVFDALVDLLEEEARAARREELRRRLRSSVH